MKSDQNLKSNHLLPLRGKAKQNFILFPLCVCIVVLCRSEKQKKKRQFFESVLKLKLQFFFKLTFSLKKRERN